MVEKFNTVVVGGGQAGLAMSNHLSKFDVPHLVLERGRIAEKWRSGRWDSLVANGPAWHDRFPELEFVNTDPEAFVPKEQVADYFVDYAKLISAPIRCGVSVERVTRLQGRPGFQVETSDGVVEADNVVAATGAFQSPVIPPVVPSDAPVVQIHSHAYRNPDQMPAGAVLVVGSGSSGAQIADELARAGRQVYLSVGPHDRPPRAYRQRDYCWWLGVLGKWDATHVVAGKEHVTIAVSGADGGSTVDFRKLAETGITLLGMTSAYRNGSLSFADDLQRNIKLGDENYLEVLQEADAYIKSHGLTLPEEPEAHVIGGDPLCLSEPILELDLAKKGIASIIWATGYSVDYSWINADTFDDTGKPRHHRGVSQEPGIYFLGLPWQSRRGSSFIWGVWHDAMYVADHIATRQRYSAYSPVSKSA